VAHSLSFGGVEIVDNGNTQATRAGLDHPLNDGSGLLDIGHVEGSGSAMVWTTQTRIALGTDEVRQDVVIPPTFIAQITPAIVVGTMPTNVNHVVEAARATEYLSTRPKVRAPPKARLRSGLVGPVVLGTPECSDEPGSRDREGFVRPSSFNKENTLERVFAKTGRDDGSAGTGTHDDVIELHRASTRRVSWVGRMSLPSRQVAVSR
jgi:hypothetical protein